MPRRVNLSCDGYYHIVQKAAAGTMLFYNDKNRMMFIGLLKQLVENYDIELCSFVLMDNHVHLLVKTSGFNLSKPMKFLFQKYAKYLNYDRKTQGCVFKDRFFSDTIRNDLYLLVCSIYIHLNPVKANLVRDCSEFRWSSVSVFLNNKQSFLSTEYILEKIDSINHMKAINVYMQLIYNNKLFSLTNLIDDKHNLEEFFCDFVIESDLDKLLDTSYSKCISKAKHFKNLLAKCREIKRINNDTDETSIKELISHFVSKGYTQSLIAKRLGRSKITIARIIKQNNLYDTFESRN